MQFGFFILGGGIKECKRFSCGRGVLLLRELGDSELLCGVYLGPMIGGRRRWGLGYWPRLYSL